MAQSFLGSRLASVCGNYLHPRNGQYTGQIHFPLFEAGASPPASAGRHKTSRVLQHHYRHSLSLYILESSGQPL
ncbi:hypothetical protein E2C01_067448 [Portunus trituberculatus]|uniref:Uncharacterized protein n=1 Tax=Portunus trituberculatus TaxID=210409 RepID=A0A5B7HL09_PORTR|nr:hypothetical protein [Portunus trituberculatus]